MNSSDSIFNTSERSDTQCYPQYLFIIKSEEDIFVFNFGDWFFKIVVSYKNGLRISAIFAHGGSLEI